MHPIHAPLLDMHHYDYSSERLVELLLFQAFLEAETMMALATTLQLPRPKDFGSFSDVIIVHPTKRCQGERSLSRYNIKLSFALERGTSLAVVYVHWPNATHPLPRDV